MKSNKQNYFNNTKYFKLFNCFNNFSTGALKNNFLTMINMHES
jgi:hypothetical protein